MKKYVNGDEEIISKPCGRFRECMPKNIFLLAPSFGVQRLEMFYTDFVPGRRSLYVAKVLLLLKPSNYSTFPCLVPCADKAVAAGRLPVVHIS